MPGSPAAGAATWSPERVITASEARRLVGERFPELAHGRSELFAEGWDNTAIRITTPSLDTLFRFPRRQVAVAGIRRELAWLPRLAPLLPLPITHPIWSGSWTAGGEPWPYWGARLLPGDELMRDAVPDADREGIAAQLGDFLRALHGTDPGPDSGTDASEEPPLPNDPLGRGDPPRRAALTRDALGRLATRGLQIPVAAADQLLVAAGRLPAPTGPGVLCHGDLHGRHVLVRHDPAASASGIIDWGDFCRGDPGIDLSIAYSAFRGHPRKALLDAYGPVDHERELRARALALFLCAMLAEYALDPTVAAGPTLLPEAVRSLWRAVED